MKIAGRQSFGLPEEILVLPRPGEPIVFIARGLPDLDDFEKLCPEPQPPGKLTKDGWVPNPDDKGYKAIVAAYHKKRLAYMVIKSLEPTEIEWDHVSLDNPATWTNWDKELKAEGLTQVEVNRVIQIVLEANCLSEDKLKAAREGFQRGRQPAPAEFSSPHTEPESSQSGKPAPASE
jgi:hypothetical protein